MCRRCNFYWSFNHATTILTSTIKTNDVSDGLARRVIIALSIATFGSGMSMRIMDPMLVQLSLDFAIPLGTASLTITVFGVAYGFAQLIFGPLGDRYGKVKIVAWGCCACSLAAFFCGITTEFTSLLIARVLAGITAASIIPLSMAWIGDVVIYEHRQSVLAKFLIDHILGLSTGVFLGGFSVDFFHCRLPFFFICVWYAAISAHLGLVIQRLPESTHIIQLGEGVGLSRIVGEFRQALNVAWSKQVLLTVTLEGAAVFGALAFLPAHLHTVHNVSLFYSGALVVLFALVGLAFVFRSRFLVSRFGEVGLIRAGALLMCTALLFLAWIPFWWWLMPACFLFGLGFYMMHNTLQINATQMAPERRGAAVAAFALCFFYGTVLRGCY